MPRGEKSKTKQKRRDGRQEGLRGLSDEEADRRAWAIVNKHGYGSQKTERKTKHGCNEER